MGGDKSRPYVIKLWRRHRIHNLCSGEVHPRLAGGDKSRPYVIKLWRRRRMHNLCSGGVHLRLVGVDGTDALSFKPDCSATLQGRAVLSWFQGRAVLPLHEAEA
jgi:hypothetical protein